MDSVPALSPNITLVAREKERELPSLLCNIHTHCPVYCLNSQNYFRKDKEPTTALMAPHSVITSQGSENRQFHLSGGTGGKNQIQPFPARCCMILR